MDQLYDGHPHLTIAPYIWIPSVSSDFQYSVPPLRHGHGGGGGREFSANIQVGPSQYLSNINTTGMLDVGYQQGRLNVTGDAIYLNASSTATVQSIVSGPHGRINIPVTINSSPRLATTIWEIAGGYTIAKGHQADAIMFLGYRSFPVNITAGFDTVVGKRNFIGPSGTVSTSATASDAIFGLRGKAFFGQDHWVVPYYFDYGTGSNNQSWQAYSGAGYVFNHGQSILALWRTLNYNTFPSASPVQKITLYGPLIGYSF